MSHLSLLGRSVVARGLVALCALAPDAGGAQPVQKDASAPAPSAPAAALAPSDRVPLDPAVVAGRLPNGVRYLLRRNARPEKRIALRLVVDAGSVLEDDDQRGLAHFVEHMAFNGTRRFPRQAIVDFLERSGVRFGADLNASTSFDETIYQLDVPTDKPAVIDTAVQILADWAHAVTFDSAEVVRERGVVLEEWRLGQGAQTRIANAQRPIVLKGSRYAVRLPIGDRATIESADPGHLRRFYRDWYRPDLMSVVAVGDADPAVVQRLVTREFGALPRVAAPRPRPSYDVPPHAETLTTVATDPEATSSVVSVLYKRPARSDVTIADERRSFVEALADMMLNARLAEIGQRPNAPYLGAGAGGGRWVRSEEAYSVGAAVRDGALVPGLEAVLSEVERVHRSGFTAAELDRERRNLLRAVEREYTERDKTSNQAHVARLVDHALMDDPAPSAAFEWAFAQRELPRVTLADVNRAIADRLEGASRVVAVQAPERAGASVPPADSLLAVFTRVQGATLTAYADSATDTPLVPSPPAPGQIVATRTIASIGVTEWTLSNGAHVLLKPTDFKADEVVLQAFSPGGTSVVPDSDFVAASLASAVAQQGGLGSFDAIALQKRLAGTAAAVSPYVGGQSEGFSGQASPKDLETLFQLTYLSATAPRADTAAYGAFRARIDNFLANRGRDPQAVFGDTVAVTMSQHHFRSRPITADVIKELDLPRAMRVYRDRFADAGSFTYVLVGSFAIDSVRPLVERYIASLPGGTRTETPRDVGERPPTGVVERTVRRGVEPQATTQLVLTGPMAYSREERFALGVLSDVLTIRLRDRIREALGGTYGVDVSASAQRVPRQAYTMVVAFGSSPERTDELTKAVLGELAAMRDQGPTAAEVQKVRETGIRELETSLKQNRWWLGAIASSLQAGEDVSRIMGERALYDTITPASVQTAAKKYLTLANYARFTLLPEAAKP